MYTQTHKMAGKFNNNNDEISVVAQPQRQYLVSDESLTLLVLDTGDSILRLNQLIHYNQLRRVSKKMDSFAGLHMQPKCTGLNRIMSVYVLLSTVVPRLLRAKVDRHN